MSESIIVNFDRQYEPEIRRIRNSVFTGEQNVHENVDFDGRDPEAVHVLVRPEDSFVGTGRMLMDGHIGRLAVLKPYRGKGFGAEAVSALIAEAKRTGIKRVYLGAQIHAVGFYQKLGFHEYGSIFMDGPGIEHIHMEKIIRDWS
ncbi:MAG: GNAT family N-acetyltransferase [Deltaproteobacteria bacterium]|nr:GNAT family N-acetyltransferase [Deltaproteobacteria bacterium]